MDTLSAEHSTSLPMREISALATRAGEAGAELLAVGDEDFAVVAAELDAEDRPSRTWRLDLRNVLPREYLDSESGSGFEAIASDSDGTILVLQEEEARILVLSADGSELLQTIALLVPEGQPGFGREWHDNPNERAEGLALLAGGHVLVAKQKNPVYLIEFGPDGDAPSGITPDTILSPRDAFDRPPGDVAEFRPLAGWPLGDSTAKTLPTVNDIAAGPDQRVYLISSKRQVIARLEKRLDPGERARAEKAWKIDRGIPGGDDARPEGLALTAAARPTVGIDTKLAGDNLVQLSALA